MSNLLFPVLKGLMWDVQKDAQFSTIVQTPTLPKNEVRVSLTPQPQYKFTLAYEFFRQNIAIPSGGSYTELDTIEGFFLSRNGSFDSFLLNLTNLTQNTTDSVAAAQQIGIGDGSNKVFQLQRSHGGFTETVDAASATGFNIYFNGVLQSAAGYTLNANTGTVTFGTAPGAGVIITADFTFYYRVRFQEDVASFNNFSFKLWELQTIVLLQVSN